MAGTSFKQRRGTAQQWSTGNPILFEGELGYETDTGRIKFGDGVNRWNALPVALRSDYLPILGKAADSEKLDGHDSTEFLLKSEGTATYLPLLTAASTYQRQDGIVSAATPNAPVKRDTQGSAAFNEVTLTGQTTAASGARKDYVDNGDAATLSAAGTEAETALTGATGGTSATRKLSYHWGNVIAFPSAGVLVGDTCRRTDLGNSVWTYDGANWWPDTPIKGKIWRNTGFPAATLADGVSTLVDMDVGRVSGGFIANVAGALADLQLPLDGIYRVMGVAYYSGGGNVQCGGDVARNRTGISDGGVVPIGFATKPGVSDMSLPFHAEIPLKANDKLYLREMVAGGSTTKYYGAPTNESFLWLSAEWIAPLNGATPV